MHPTSHSIILDDINLIESRPDVMIVKPVVAGTRQITVEGIFERRAAGETIDRIIEEHPRLTLEVVLAAIEFSVPEKEAIGSGNRIFK